MNNSKKENAPSGKFSRRGFLKVLGSAAGGILAAPYINAPDIFAVDKNRNTSFLTKVAITKADSYDRVYIKNKVQYLFESIDGISDIIKAGNKVGIKINLTGGSGNANNSKLNGVPITESVWTHPEVVRAVGELVIDCGVSPDSIYIVEALWDTSSFNDFGFLDVQQSLGAKMVNLNNKAPYSSFIDMNVGDKKYFYNSFKVNQILNDIDVYISIPKLKHHYEAGVTCSIKNQIGMVPIQNYRLPENQSFRSALHFEGGDIGVHLPHSVSDLNLARPVNLAVIDGIKNAHGGEGTWISTFQLAEDNVLLAGKDPVATDSICAHLLGNNPEAEKFDLPDGVRQCLNYLDLLHQRGVGTNQLSEIEVVGDGADLITSVQPEKIKNKPTNIVLYRNYPNPFNPSTTITFYLPEKESVNIKIYSMNGQEIETLVDSEIPAGLHELHWNANNLASGVYIYKMNAGSFTETKKMIYQK
jgi:uncharacterized protein (DUF362 family)